MKKPNDGGPAFPSGDGSTEDIYTPQHEGMSLRAYFAAAAMEGMIASCADGWPEIDCVSKRSIMYADALIKELGE